MAKLDMSLDEIIQMNKGKKLASRSPNFGHGPSRRFLNRAPKRSLPYDRVKVHAPETKWTHDMFARHDVSYPATFNRQSYVETGTKLLISNLDYGVSDEDIKDLFSDVGLLTKHTVDYDKSGRSKGTAVVVYLRREDAEAAVKRYNNIQLDGKPMKVEIEKMVTASAAIMTPSRPYGIRRVEERSGLIGQSCGRNIPTRRRGLGNGVKPSGDGYVSKEDLDVDLEKYLAPGSQTH